MISIAVMTTSTAWRKLAASKFPAPSTNFIRLNEARLQAVSSRNMYSEQGLEALMRPLALEVCQRLTVVSYCIPGSPHWWAASAICRSKARALYSRMGWPLRTDLVHQGLSSAAACLKSSVTRTEGLAVWKKKELEAPPSGEV